MASSKSKFNLPNPNYKGLLDHINARVDSTRISLFIDADDSFSNFVDVYRK